MAPTSRQKNALYQDRKEFESIFSKEAYAYYQKIALSTENSKSAQFIMLDSKSLPRSGLHYMKNTFAKLLGGHFSFCEWYQEPGCCKKMPCALRGYARDCERTKISKLRLIKSHDIDLSDPIFAPTQNVQRVILVRNPLFLLTSWFVLDQLPAYKTALSRSGISLEKIWFSHEPEVLAVAYEVIDKIFVRPRDETLNNWLAEKTSYISKFIEKWVPLPGDRPQPFLHIVRYEQIDSFIAATVREVRDHLPVVMQDRIDLFVQSMHETFRPRADPFHAPSERLSGYLSENSRAFLEAAERVLAADSSGVMRRAALPR